MQKRLKRIFAFICAFALLTTTVLGSSAMRLAQAADTEPTPVELDGFETVTVEDFQDSAGTEMESKTYAYDSANTTATFSLKDGTNFNKKLVSMNVKFESSTEGMHARMVLGNSGDIWNGLWVFSSTDGTTLHIYEMKGGTWRHMEGDITSANANVTSFMNTEFLLQLSLEDTDGGLVLGVYVDGELCQTYTWTDAKTSDYAGSYMNLYRETTGTAITVGAVSSETSTEPTPVELPGFETVTVEDFQDSAGTEMESKEYAYDAANTTSTFSLKDGTNFNKKLLSMNVKFESSTEGMHARMVLGNSGDIWNGLWVFSSTDGTTLHIYEMKGGTWRHMEGDITSTNANVTSFMNTEFLLQLSLEDTDGGLVLGVYVDGELCQTYTWTDAKTSDYAGSYMNLYRETTGTAITVGSINEDDDSQGPGTDDPGTDSTPEGPVELDGFTNVTVGDFVYAGTENPMEEKEYTTGADFQLKSGDNFDKKLFTAKVKITDPANANWWSNRIYIGGTEANGWGLALCVDGANNVLKLAEFDSNIDGDSNTNFTRDITAAAAGVDSFLDTEFILQVGYEYLDNDNGGTANDVRVLVYVDGNKVSDEIFSNCNMDRLGNYIRLYYETAYAVQIGAVASSEETPDGPGGDTPTVYTDVTFQDFGIENNIYYSKGSGLAVEGTLEEKDDLDKIALSGDILLTGESTDTFDLMLGSKNNDVWSGIKLWINGKTMTLNLGTSTNVAILDSETAGVGSTFANNKFTFKWSVEFVCNDNDNQYNDVKVGLWFNGNLYEDTYFTISNGGTAAELGKSFAVCCESGSSSITINPDAIDDSDEEDENPIQPNDDFTKLTFAHFGIKDNTYKYNGDLVVKGSLSDLATLDRTVLYGNVLLEGEGSYQLIFGGKEDSWDGIRFIIGDANSMTLEWFGRNDVRIPVTVFNSMVAGVDFVGEAYDLAVSTELIDADGDGQKNDIQFGFWFNGKLYDNSYVVVKDQGATLGNRFAAYCSGEDSAVILNSDPNLVPKPKQPNESFEKITFEYFGAADGTYKYNGTDAPTYEGKGRDTMDEKVFCGDFLFTGVGGNQFMIGGDGNTWYGLCFIVTDDDKIALLWIDEEGAITVETYDALTAGTPLVGEWLNLMISTEILDADGDGAEDDIELGVWFNGALYKESFSTILNKASGLGNCFGMYSGKEGSSISIRSIPEYIKGFDYAAFGLTKDWEKTLLGTGFKAETAVGGSRDAEPFTGDLLEVGKVCLFSAAGIAAILAGIYVMLQRKRES